MKIVLIIIICIFVLGCITLLWGIYASKDLIVKTIEMKNNKIPDSFNNYKIVFLSDLHNREIGENQAKLARTILAQNPDIVIIGGDMISGKDTNIINAKNLCEKLTENVDVIWVKGNHYYKANDTTRNELDITMQSLGVIALDNEKMIISYLNNEYIKGTDKPHDTIEYITISGVTDPLRLVGTSYPPKEYEKLASISIMIRQLDEITLDDTYNILISHRPNYPEIYKAKEFDLTLSGHSHGGQLKLPTGIEVIGVNGFFPTILSGNNDIDGMPLVITSGIGYSNMNIRTFNPPEILVITLIKE